MKSTELESTERFLKKFQQLETADVKQGAITMLSAYISGMMEERAKWEKRKLQETA